MPFQRRLTTLKGNKRKLTREFGYNSIRGFRNEHPLSFRTDAEAYNYLLDEYNSIGEILNEQERVRRAAVKAARQAAARRARAAARQKVSQVVSIKYKYHFKRSENQKITDTKSATITGTVGTIEQLRKNKIAELLIDIEEDYPKILDEIISENVAAPILMRTGLGGRFNSTTPIASTRMRRLGALMLDNNYTGETSWDRQQDTCVFDYLYHEYADYKGFKKFLPKDDRELAYDNLNKLFAGFDEQINPLTEGVSTEQLQHFAEKFKLPIIALDKNENLIVYNRPSVVNKDAKPLIFMIANEHFYPIDDKKKRLSISAKSRDKEQDDETRFKAIRNWSSVDIETGTFEKTTSENAPIFPTENEPIGNDYLMYIIKQKKTIPKKVECDGNKVVRFTIGEQKYYTSKKTDLEDRIETYVESINETYWGQSINRLINELFEEHYEKELVKSGMNSRFNPAVYEVLLDDKVKYRQHYGATIDNTPLLELTDEQFIDTIEEKEIDVPYTDIFTGEKRVKKDLIKLRNKVAIPRKRIIDDMVEKGQAVCYDLNKLYTSCLNDAYDNFMVFNEEDTIYKFNQDLTKPLPTGLYYVATQDLTLLHQSNWYSNKIIDMAIREGLGKKLVIRWEFIPKARYENQGSLPKDYFKELIEKAYATGLGKEMINTLVGYLGKTITHSKVVECDTDVEEIWRCFMSCEKPEDATKHDHYYFKEEYEDSNYNRFNSTNIIVENIGEGDDPLYLYGYEKTSGRNECSLPIWIQILDWSNMRLFEMSKKVGGTVAFRHTDCVLCIGGKVGLDTQGFGGFKKENHTKLNLSSMMKTDRHYTTWKWQGRWKENKKLNDSNMWQEIIQYATDEEGLLIEGRAGTGKSYIPTTAMAQDVLKLDADTLTASFTNKASRNIKGKTLHRTLNISKNYTIPVKTLTSFKYKKYIVIDEIGMISSDIWRLLKHVKQKYPYLIFILLGDYRQLPPIENENLRISDDKLDIFNLPIVKYLVNYNKIELTTRQRYDKPLWDYLEEGFNNRNWGELPKRSTTPEEIYKNKAICYYNKTRDRVNNSCMRYFKQNTKHMNIDYVRKTDDDKANNISIYNGLPVMAYVNNRDMGIVNSEEFTVVDWNKEIITLKRDCDLPNIEVELDKFHKYFVCNYCSTTHKSQGATYDGTIILFDWDKIKRDRNVAYTACSRGRSLNKLIVADDIKK